MVDTFDIQRSISGQGRFCDEHNYPYFAPANGVCYRCHRNIYSPPYGHRVIAAENSLITYCPYCHYSFVE